MKKSTPETPERLPVKLDSTSNGEYWPVTPSRALRAVQRAAMERALVNARRVGLSRREYLASSCGVATVLIALNQLGCGGGRYRVSPDAPLDKASADQVLTGKEFIFDVQTHEVSGDRVWWISSQPSIAYFLKTTPTSRLWSPSLGAVLYGRCADSRGVSEQRYSARGTQRALGRSASAVRRGGRAYPRESRAAWERPASHPWRGSTHHGPMVENCRGAARPGGQLANQRLEAVHGLGTQRKRLVVDRRDRSQDDRTRPLSRRSTDRHPQGFAAARHGSQLHARARRGPGGSRLSERDLSHLPLRLRARGLRG